jgi:hypothetical protein
VSKIEIQGGTGDTGEEDQGVVGSFVVAGHDDEVHLGGREAKYMSQHMCSVMKRSCMAIRNTREQWFKEAYDRKELVLIQRQVKSTKCTQMQE